MPKFVVRIEDTRPYELEVEAPDEATAKAEASHLFRDADDIGEWEVVGHEHRAVAARLKKPDREPRADAA